MISRFHKYNYRHELHGLTRIKSAQSEARNLKYCTEIIFMKTLEFVAIREIRGKLSLENLAIPGTLYCVITNHAVYH